MSNLGPLGERFVSELTGNVFLREFALSSALLSVDEGEIELADTMVLLRSLVLVCQVKERDPAADNSVKALDRWFKKKVEDSAVGQVAASRRYLQEHAGRTLRNDRGHEVTLSATSDRVVCLAVYSAAAASHYRGSMGRDSSRAGFVHFIEAADYFGVCSVLRTPVEIADYLAHRETQLRAIGTMAADVSEAAMLGHFLVEAEGLPQERYAAALDLLVDAGADSDLSRMLSELGDRVEYRAGEVGPTSHYSILQELAVLSRTGLAHFKERFKLCADTVKAGEFRSPTHFANPDTDCGFVLAPWDERLGIAQQDYLRVLTELSKYSLGVRRQVGVLVSIDEEDVYVLWSFMDEEHRPDPNLDAALAAKGCPLPPVSTKEIPKYHFDSAGLEALLRSE